MRARILGIGTDIVEIARIRSAMASPRFLSRILTEAERRPNPSAEWVAGRWAAKEAVAKAAGIDLKWHDVEIGNDESGRPFALLRRNLELGPVAVHVSISHERGYAVAMVVVESADSESDTI